MKIETIAPRIKGLSVKDQLSQPMADRLQDAAAHLDEQGSALERAGMSARARQVRVLSNNLISVSDAIEDGDADLAVLKDMQKRITDFDEQVDQINIELSSMHSTKVVSEFANVIPSLQQVLSKVDVNEVETAVARDISEVLLQLATRNKMLRRKLPRNSVKTYSLVKLPVVLVTNHKVDKRSIKSAGFDVSDFQGYPVIEDQILLAVRHDYAREYDMDSLEMAQEIIATINSTTKAELALVDEESRVPEGEPKTFGYYWVMPQGYYNRFAPILGSFDNWGLAV